MRKPPRRRRRGRCRLEPSGHASAGNVRAACEMRSSGRHSLPFPAALLETWTTCASTCGPSTPPSEKTTRADSPFVVRKADAAHLEHLDVVVPVPGIYSWQGASRALGRLAAATIEGAPGLPEISSALRPVRASSHMSSQVWLSRTAWMVAASTLDPTTVTPCPFRKRTSRSPMAETICWPSSGC